VGKEFVTKCPELCQPAIPCRVNGYISFLLSVEVEIEKALGFRFEASEKRNLEKEDKVLSGPFR
jgi:hypothetical protein